MEDVKIKIAENREKLQKLLEKKDNINVLEKWLESELTYTSNAIEGNTLTKKETELAIDEKITSSAKPIKDYLEAINHAKAVEFIIESAKKKTQIDEDFILNVHRMILNGDDVHAGFYRSVRVRISGSRTVLPNPLKVPDLMSDFNKWLLTKTDDPLTQALEAHYRLVSIHPFIDGNGRTARLLLNAILLKNGYAPIIIRPIDRKRYLDALETYQTEEDPKNYYNFMLGALNRSLKTMISLLDINAKEPTNEMIKIAAFAELCNLPVSTIRYWIQEGKLRPATFTQSGYALFEPGQAEKLKKEQNALVIGKIKGASRE